MADQYGLFWNSVSGDRTYDADSFSEWLGKFFTTGVFNGDLQVTPGGGMVVDVGSGYANINGKVRFFDTDTSITISPASGVYPRIDTIVVRADYTNREITLEYVTGSYSGNNPQPTAPTRNASMYEIVLAQILVSAGSTEVTARSITDTRAYDSVCGWVTSTVESVPMDQIVSQMQTEFLTWFDEMKDQLSEDAAGHLQQEIDTISSAVTSTNTKIGATDISTIGDGTITGAVSSLNNGLTPEIVKVTSDLINGDITFIKSGKVVTVNFFNDTKAAVPAWGESKLCAIPNGMLPAFDNEWNHGTITIQDGITTILVAYVDGIYVENKTSQTIGRGSWISGRLTYICE